MILAASGSTIKRVLLVVRDTFNSQVDRFGLWRKYFHRPTIEPDHFITPNDLSNRHSAAAAQTSANNGPSGFSPLPRPPLPWPYPNMSIYHLLTWLSTGSRKKTTGEGTRLAQMISAEGSDFKAADLEGINITREAKRADDAEMKLKQAAFIEGFKKETIYVSVPSGEKGRPPLSLAVEGLHYQSLLSVIRSAFTESVLALRYHLTPFQLFHNSATGRSQRVYGELYTSDVWIHEHEKVQRAKLHPDDIGCKLERIIAALMFWSDSTHLANFGTAKAWPIYLMFGNLSKYFRANTSSGACHHVGYIPSVHILLTLIHTFNLFRPPSASRQH
jgi:hypothetical protein